MSAQHDKFGVTGLVWFISLIFFIGIAYGADPMLSEVQSLLREMDALKQDFKKADEEKVKVDKEEKTLIQTGELIKQAEENYKKEAMQLQQEWNKRGADVSRHNANKCKSDDAACIDAYNAEADRQNALKMTLMDKEKTVEERKKVVNERREGLNKAVNEWAQRKKENNARLNELQAKYNFQIKRIRGLTVMSSGRQLIQKSGASQECANIPGIEKLEKQLDGAAERAHRCLQKIWDGAQ